MIDLNPLRALVLRKEFSAKHLILSKGEIEVVDMANLKPITSGELVVKRGISPQQACNMLKALKDKGYLESEILPDDDGRKIRSLYYIPEDLRKLL